MAILGLTEVFRVCLLGHTLLILPSPHFICDTVSKVY